MARDTVLRRRDPTPGAGLRLALAAQTADPEPIPAPPSDPEVVRATCDTFVLERFTAEDAWELGHLLYARLAPVAARRGQPTLVSVALAGGATVAFQAAVGAGTTPDNEAWARRKRAAALRFAASTWLLRCRYGPGAAGDDAFRRRAGLGPEEAAAYAIHGGAVPIRVHGVEGVVAVVVVSGLKPEEDHGVIVDVLNKHWEPVT
ncbi:hypothetical protein GGS23DRAFT_597925 [Durotheca rogersii]|uniref:uncharacterized protein n=1 Tax=Durotheca rogersii TaxID=419775 RepID=UPI0022204FD4|nr:uncharacterized protein GGS23DRAFT_597925 [Durotheca rogersii]KAI5861903.1 hypothetical protein GGS23DRAFT_597925 [Durotheca rogersii]